jgi:dihydrofolate reductase
MRKIVSGFACSVDGYIEGLKGEYDWIIIDKEIDFSEQAKQYDTYLYGRKTYEAVAKMGGIDKSSKHYVFSRSLDKVKPGFTVVKGDIRDEVNRIKNSPGKDIALFGGAGLLASLLKLNLVDEIKISYIPVLLGSGKPMVEILEDKVWLELITTKTYKIGTVTISYKVLQHKK